MSGRILTATLVNRVTASFEVRDIFGCTKRYPVNDYIILLSNKKCYQLDSVLVPFMSRKSMQ